MSSVRFQNREPGTKRFAFGDDFDRMCRCGHRLGVHGPGGIECLAGTNVPNDPNPRGVECACTKFKPAPAPRTVSIQCNYDRCRHMMMFQVQKGARMTDANHDLDEAAGQLGWVIGLDRDGQAQHACPDHAFSLIDAMPLADMRSRKSRPWALCDSMPVERG